MRIALELSLLRFLIILAGGFVLLAVFAYLDVSGRDRHRIFTAETVASRPAALVLGAGVYPSGRLSIVLSDRMNTAISLYEAGKVERLLLSGDNSVDHYNEPARMGEYALAAGLPATALAYDFAGRRTYDSCWRARHIFGLDQVIVVTQAFHLPRALYLCQQAGIDAVGVVADQRAYQFARWFAFREAFARVQAWLDVHLLHPQPIGGPPIDIFALHTT